MLTAGRTVLVAAAIALVCAGCSGSDEPAADQGTPDVGRTAASVDAWVEGYCDALVPVREREAAMATASQGTTPATYPDVMGAEFAAVGDLYTAASRSLAEVGASPEAGGGTVHETVVTGLFDVGTAYATWSESLLALPDDAEAGEISTLYETWSPAVQQAGEAMAAVLTPDISTAIGQSPSCSDLFG